MTLGSHFRRRPTTSLSRIAPLAAFLLAATISILAAAPPAELGQRVAALVAQLSDDRFGVREEARRELTALAAAPATQTEVRSLLTPRAVDPKLPFEVREILQALVPPSTKPKDNEVAETAEARTNRVAACLDDLDADSFERREQAVTQLTALAEQPAVAGPLLWQIKDRLTEANASVDSLRRLRTVWEIALRTWVTTNPPLWKSPVVDDATIDAVLDRYTSAKEDPNRPDWLQPYALAERELLLMLTCDDVAPRVTAALKRRLEATDLTPATAGRLERVYIQARPAMAAEFWQSGRHHSVQHLLIGVPNQPAGAPRPSLFDHCDEKVARCVSGNSLAPGEHPVGIFFPHPSDMQGDAQFHLVNLPTPRRRMAYAYEVPAATTSAEELLRIDVRRRREISARTLARLTENKRPLSERETDMLAHLDPTETARFAKKYLLSVADERYDSGSPQAFGNGSLHGWFCFVLSTLDVPESGEAIAAAIDKRRILEPTDAKPYRIEWVALLDVSKSSPWPGLDAWLAGQVERTEAINVREPDAADVGASAAALLLHRNGRDPDEFFLQRRDFPELIDLGNPGYRFTKPEGRAAVKTWWREKQADRDISK